jgi:hypothetical protein
MPNISSVPHASHISCAKAARIPQRTRTITGQKFFFEITLKCPELMSKDASGPRWRSLDNSWRLKTTCNVLATR